MFVKGFNLKLPFMYISNMKKYDLSFGGNSPESVQMIPAFGFITVSYSRIRSNDKIYGP